MAELAADEGKKKKTRRPPPIKIGKRSHACAFRRNAFDLRLRLLVSRFSARAQTEIIKGE